MAASNVVNLSDHERARRNLSPAEQGRILNACRDLAMRRLAESLRGMLGQLEEDLFRTAEATYDRELQNLYLEARGQARANWSRIEGAFSRQFVDSFNRKVRGELGAAVQSLAVSAEDLRLVEEDDLAESIALQELATRLREQCEDDLYLLGERVALLLGRNELGEEDNPVSPQAVCTALKRACDEIEGGVKLKLVLLKQLERHVSRALRSVYADLNAELARWNILPELRRGYRRPAGSPPGADSRSAAAPASGGQSAADLFAALQQLIQAQYLAPAPAAPALAPVPPSTPPATDSFSTGLFEALTRMQRAESASPLTGGENLLRRIRASHAAQGVAQPDAITFDIVAMLFDFVFDDAKIPDAVKALLARLQIPVLKVAILDKSFFASKAHPARRLLDAISRASMGWGREVDQADPLYREMARVVGRVQTEFDREVGLFAEVLGELEVFLAAREAQAVQLAERSAALMEQREKEEIAWIIAGEAVSRRLSPVVPLAVQQFLLDHWQPVLKTLCLRHGEEHHAYLSAVATIDDLVWSVAPKTGADERRQLVGTLPGLLRALHGGLDLIDLAPAPREAFFDALVGLHSAAVKAGLPAAAPGRREEARSALQASPAGPMEQYRVNPEGELLVTHISGGEVQIDEVALLGGPADAPQADEHRLRVAGLERGDWVEFRHDEGGTMRARLSWVSPKRGIYLFTNPRSPRAMAVSPEALAHQFRIGLAEPIADEPLFDRAVNGLLGSLQGL